MRLLQNRIGVGNQGAWFAQTKAQSPKHSLALTRAQSNPVAPCEPGLESFPVPHRSGQAHIARRTPQYRLHLLELCLAEALRPSRPRSFDQSGQTSLLKMSDPVFHRAWSIAQESTHLRARHTLSHQQYSMQAVIVPRLLRTANLILKPKNHRFGISNSEWFHVSMKPQFESMRNYL
jgi:hypothetical protein